MCGFLLKNTSYGDLFDSFPLRGNRLYMNPAHFLASSQYASDSPDVNSIAVAASPSVRQLLSITPFCSGVYGHVVEH